MNDRNEFLAAVAASAIVFAGIIVPETLLLMALGAIGVGLVARLAEAVHVPAQEVQNRR
jgi:hypothetical protein